jgi:hypothetical protein
MAFFLLVTSSVAAVSVWYVSLLLSTYLKARKLGIPILFAPVDPLHPIGILATLLFSPVLKKIPFGLGSFLDYGTFDWCYKTKNEIHDRLGPIFIIVYPGSSKIMLSDGQAIAEAFTRTKDFLKPGWAYEPLAAFGPNVDSTNGEDWQRHRKITVPPFNERNVSLNVPSHAIILPLLNCFGICLSITKVANCLLFLE